MVVLLMGVSGVGKTTIGRRLADDLAWSYIEGDDLHPPQNIQKMQRGEPLTDADRKPWLLTLHALIHDHLVHGEPAVMTCSALKKAYRDLLCRDNDGLHMVYLHGDLDLIKARLQQRQGHFFHADLLASQFEALEVPADALVVEVDRPVETLVAQIKTALGLPLTEKG